MAAFIQRTKSSSSKIHLSLIRSVGYGRKSLGAIFVGQFLPSLRFSSTVAPDKLITSIYGPKPSAESNHDFNYPMECMYDDESRILLRYNKHENIKLEIHEGASKLVDDDNRNVSMNACITREGMWMGFELTVQPNMLAIHSLKMGARHKSEGLQEYLSTKGVNAGLCAALFNCLNQPKDLAIGQFPTLRFSTGPTPQTSEKCSIDGLLRPFDIKDGGPSEGYLTLIKNCGDEIIEIKVRPYYGTRNIKGIEILNDREEVMKIFGVKEAEMEEDIDGEEEDLTTTMSEIGKWDPKFSTYDDDDDRCIEHLYTVVKIYFGEAYKKWLKFFIHAYPESGDFDIRRITTSVEGDTKHLEEYEEFLKDIGLEPSNINKLLDRTYFKKKQLFGSKK